jgi:hypothetical protein
MIIPWFPWLQRLSIAAGISGFAILGATWLGPLGLPLGALLGIFIGYFTVNIPLVLWASWKLDWLRSQTTEQLLSRFVPNPRIGRTGDFQVAMILMKERGADVRPVLPVLLDLMGSPKLSRRLHAWVTFLEGFRELEDRLGDYSPYEPAEVCHVKISSKRSALVRAGEVANEGEQGANPGTP